MFEISFIDLLISFYQIKSTNKCCITLPEKVIFFSRSYGSFIEQNYLSVHTIWTNHL